MSRCDLSKYYTSGSFYVIRTDIDHLATGLRNLVNCYIRSGYATFIFQKPGHDLLAVPTQLEMVLWWKKIHSFLIACAISVQNGIIGGKKEVQS